MAIDKALGQAPLGLDLEQMMDEPAIEIEIEDPEAVRIGIDGQPILEIEEAEAEDDFNANLAEEMEDGELTELCGDLLGEFDMEDDGPDYNNISDLEDELRKLVRWSNQYGSKGADAQIDQLRKRIEYLKSQVTNEETSDDANFDSATTGASGLQTMNPLPIKEGRYSEFKKTTQVRTPSEQMHRAVREIRRKIDEINKLVDYTEKMKTEMKEDVTEVRYLNLYYIPPWWLPII